MNPVWVTACLWQKGFVASRAFSAANTVLLSEAYVWEKAEEKSFRIEGSYYY